MKQPLLTMYCLPSSSLQRLIVVPEFSSIENFSMISCATCVIPCLSLIFRYIYEIITGRTKAFNEKVGNDHSIPKDVANAAGYFTTLSGDGVKAIYLREGSFSQQIQNRKKTGLISLAFCKVAHDCYKLALHMKHSRNQFLSVTPTLCQTTDDIRRWLRNEHLPVLQLCTGLTPLNFLRRVMLYQVLSLTLSTPDLLPSFDRRLPDMIDLNGELTASGKALSPGYSELIRVPISPNSAPSPICDWLFAERLYGG
ncbi:hypothetical protein T07_12731 [Trichinella nelsoni]|uniref:Uncharacterized protein n=1 Tax=Trichinella nelsoni TaxID=6336 RepID=A0A0V0RNB5_9BILA|nr:hypothetical protein T07_12731 [Trichinella nelsoni]